jgi:uncharacterized protein (DUF924 family)
MQATDILRFWFVELDNKGRFAKDAALDALLRERFYSTLQAAIRGELAHWRATPQGRLAEIIVLDQFSRNIFRDQPASFAQDPQALALAQALVASGQSITLAPEQRAFAYMPFMHSESLMIHSQAVLLFSEAGLEGVLDYEHKHQTIIERFGRFPHRNAILGRVSTPEEEAFLQQPGASF